MPDYELTQGEVIRVHTVFVSSSMVSGSDGPVVPAQAKVGMRITGLTGVVLVQHLHLIHALQKAVLVVAQVGEAEVVSAKLN